MRITAVETMAFRMPFDPPFHAAWDPNPRASQTATLVCVHGEDGLRGWASGGDGLPDAEALSRLLRGMEVSATEEVRRICATVDLHGGRPWAVEVATWDLLGRLRGEPVWRLLGGASPARLAYASTGEVVGPDERVRRALALRDAGVRALKLRLGHDGGPADIEVVAAVRAAVGDAMAIMVDANQGWRMPGDTSPSWDVPHAARVARALEPLGVHWLEEPLHAGDVDGYAALRRLTPLRLAAGELVRDEAGARDLVLRGGVDVLQCDVMFTGGIGGCRRLAALAEICGRAWSPHTWSNGMGLVANLHAAAALSSWPYVEVPLDPPGWPAERRDWLLPAPLAIAADGTVAAPDGPGLGVDPDLDTLDRFRVA